MQREQKESNAMPGFTTSDGCRLEYWLRGQGPLITLTPGGREAGEQVAALADSLAHDHQVLTWDRRNTGAADLYIQGDLAEADVWADDLAELIRHLGHDTAWLIGGSGGCRTSVATAIRHPEVTRGLVLWSASGGPYACKNLGYNYHVPFIQAAETGGMEAVCRTRFFAARIAANSSNRERLLNMDPKHFIAQMMRWHAQLEYHPDEALMGVPNEALRTIEVPTLLFAGNDDIHTEAVSNAMSELIPDATLLPCAWSIDQWNAKVHGPNAAAVYELYPAMAPTILSFIAAAENGFFR